MRNSNLDLTAIADDVKHYINTQRNFRNPKLTSNELADALAVLVLRHEAACVRHRELDDLELLAGGLGLLFGEAYARHSIVVNKANADLEKVAFLAGFMTTRNFRDKYKETYGETPMATLKALAKKAGNDI